MKLKKMRETCKARMKDSQGFTLVEMIVVLAIIAILIALIAPNVARLIGNAQETSDSATAKGIMTAAQSYATEALAGDFQIAGQNGVTTYPTGAYSITGGVCARLDDGTVGNATMTGLFFAPDGATNFDKDFIDSTGDAPIREGTIGTGGSAYVYFTPRGAVTGVVLCGGATADTILAVTGAVPETISGTGITFNNTTFVGGTVNPTTGALTVPN